MKKDQGKSGLKNKILVLLIIIFNIISIMSLTFGDADGEVTGHDHTYGPWQGNSSGHYKVCTVCSQSTGITPHNFTGWEQGTSNNVLTRRCLTCNYIETKQANPCASGHNYGGWTTIASATCTRAGRRQRTCTRCGNVESQSIPALGHNYGSWEITSQPTCTATGTRVKTCSRCRDTVSESIPALGHVESDIWSNNNQYHWKTCTRCGTMVGNTEAHIDADESGSCDICGYSMIVTVVPPVLAKTYVYNGSEQTAEFTNWNNNILLAQNDKRTDAGSQEVTVLIKNKNKYVWSTGGNEDRTYTFIIKPQVIEMPVKHNYTYDGTNKVGVEAGTNYERISDYEATDAGSYRALVRPLENYCWEDGSVGNQVLVWEIKKKPVSVTWSSPSELTYTGNLQSVIPSCVLGVTGESMTFSYEQRVNVGTYTVNAIPTAVIGGREKLSNYEVSNTTAEYSIIPTQMESDVTITLGTTSYVYDGTYHTPEVTVKNGDVVLNKNDYSVEYVNNKNAGTASVVITGVGNYSGFKTENFTIAKRELTVTPEENQETMLGVTNYTLKYTYSNNVESETPGFTGKLAKAGDNNLGPHEITIGTLRLVDNGSFLAANYTIKFTSGVIFEIKDYDCMELEVLIPERGILEIPIPANGKNNYLVSWGDGSYERIVGTGFPSHYYVTLEPKTYTVRIAGTCESFGYTGDSIVTSTNIYSSYYSFTHFLTKIKKFGNLSASKIGFSNCSNLVGPLPTPSGFENLTSVDNMFYGCEKLNGTIPEEMFKDCELIRSAKNTFYGCRLLTGQIDESLFEGCSNIRSFENTFKGCIGLTGEIPEELFKDNVEVLSFAGTFNGCTGLTQIPEKLFEKNIKNASFSETFSECTGITSISENLFLQNTLASNYYKTFYETSISSVPTNLFANNIVSRISNDINSQNDYRSTFENCTNIENLNLNIFFIGRDMFKNCTNIEEITLPSVAMIGEHAFYACNNLDNIKVGGEMLSSIESEAFMYTGTNPNILKTYVNKNNGVLVNYLWNNSNRQIDIEAPKGYVEIIAPNYPYTNTKEVQLRITVDGDPVADEIQIAILNDKTYTIPTQEELDNIGGDESLNIFNWEPYVQNKAWTLRDVEGVRTVYVYFKDKMGNISNVSVDL